MIIFRFSAIRDLFRFDVWAAAQEFKIEEGDKWWVLNFYSIRKMEKLFPFKTFATTKPPTRYQITSKTTHRDRNNHLPPRAI